MLATTPVLRRSHEITPFDGRSLRELLARGERPDRARLIGWGARLLEALAEVHAEGLVYGDLREEDVILTPGGGLVILLGPFPAGETFTVQNDLYEVGCLLRRLAFAAAIRGGRGGRGLAARDPLFKVLARAAFPDPAARYRSAGEMAEALGEVGQTAMPTVTAGPRRLEERPVSSRLAEFPGSPRASSPARPKKKEEEDGGLWYAMVLLVISLLLMTFALAAGWYVLDRDRSAMPVSGPAVLHPAHLGPSAVLSR